MTADHWITSGSIADGAALHDDQWPLVGGSADDAADGMRQPAGLWQLHLRVEIQSMQRLVQEVGLVHQLTMRRAFLARLMSEFVEEKGVLIAMQMVQPNFTIAPESWIVIHGHARFDFWQDLFQQWQDQRLGHITVIREEVIDLASDVASQPGDGKRCRHKLGMVQQTRS